MIELPNLPPYVEAPWEISLQERVRKMGKAIAQGKKIAVMLYHHADTSTFRYRCYNVMQALEQSDTWYAVYFFQTELDFVKDILSQIQLLALTRIMWSIKLENVVNAAKRRGIPVVFDVDDRVFHLDDLKLLTNAISVNLDMEGEEAYNYWFYYIGRLQKTAELAEGFITTNEYLGNELQKRFGHDYQIISNSLNKEQLQICKWLRSKKEKARHTYGFTLGYFSGSPSHRLDFQACYGEVLRFLNKYPDTNLQVVGFMDFPQSAKNLLLEGRIQTVPLVDFMELQRLVAQVDVNIAPLADNAFSNCKSELKFFEAAIVDTLTVATPTYAFAKAIENGTNGFLCKPGQWFDVLETIYLGKVDREKMCEVARADLSQRYYGESFVKQIENAYDFFLGRNRES